MFSGSGPAGDEVVLPLGDRRDRGCDAAPARHSQLTKSSVEEIMFSRVLDVNRCVGH